jgi:hypothetical protein
MRALLAALLVAGSADADIVSRCAFAFPLYGDACEAFEKTAHKLLTEVKPPGLQITDLRQSAVRFFVYVEGTGPVTGREGEMIVDTLCNLPDLRDFLNREYMMSVRMTTRRGDMTVLDEIAFIQDCEAN